MALTTDSASVKTGLPTAPSVLTSLDAIACFRSAQPCGSSSRAEAERLVMRDHRARGLTVPQSSCAVNGFMWRIRKRKYVQYSLTWPDALRYPSGHIAPSLCPFGFGVLIAR